MTLFGVVKLPTYIMDGDLGNGAIYIWVVTFLSILIYLATLFNLNSISSFSNLLTNQA